MPGDIKNVCKRLDPHTNQNVKAKMSFLDLALSKLDLTININNETRIAFKIKPKGPKLIHASINEVPPVPPADCNVKVSLNSRTKVTGLSNRKTLGTKSKGKLI